MECDNEGYLPGEQEILLKKQEINLNRSMREIERFFVMFILDQQIWTKKMLLPQSQMN